MDAGAMFHPGELEEVRLSFEPPTSWSTTVSAGPREVTLTLRARGETYVRALAEAAFERRDADEVLHGLVEDLGDWIAESSFGWAQNRWPAAPLVAPPPAHRGVARVAEVHPGEGPFPVHENATPLDPGELGLSPALSADLQAWRATWERLVTELPLCGQPEDDPWELPRDAAFGSRPIIRTDEQVAAHDRAREAAQTEADAAWRQVVDALESDRAALVERLRRELGSGWLIPTPPRIP